MDELKKCPFCGGEAEIVDIKGRESALHVFDIYCMECGVNIEKSDCLEDAVDRWNERAN